MQREGSPRFLKHHSAPVRSVCFNPKERFQFASGGGDGKVNIYTGSESSSFDLIGGYQLQTPSNKNISGIRYMCDGRKILVSASSKRISVVDVERGDQVQSFDNCAYPAHRERIPLAVDPICPYIAVCSCVNGRGLSLFDLRMPLPLEFLFELHTSVIRDIAFLDSSWPYSHAYGNSSSSARSSPSAIVSLSIDGIVKITTLDNKLLHCFDVEHAANSLAITPETFKTSSSDSGRKCTSASVRRSSRKACSFATDADRAESSKKDDDDEQVDASDEMASDTDTRILSNSSFSHGLPISMGQVHSSNISHTDHGTHSHQHRHADRLYSMSPDASSFTSYFSPTSTLIPTNIAQQIHSVLSTHQSLPSLTNHSAFLRSHATFNSVSPITCSPHTFASASDTPNAGNTTGSHHPSSINSFSSLIMIGGEGLSSFKPETNAIERLECGYSDISFTRQCSNTLHSHHCNHENSGSNGRSIQSLGSSGECKDKGVDCSSSSSSSASSSSSSPGLMSPSFSLPLPPPPPGTSSSSSSSWSHVSFPSSVISNSMSMYASNNNDIFITAGNVNLASASTTATSFLNPPVSFASTSSSVATHRCPVSPTSPTAASRSHFASYTCSNCATGHPAPVNHLSVPLLPVQIWKLKYTSTGSLLYTASDDGSVKRYRRYPNGSHKCLGEVFRHRGDVYDMDISAYDEFLVTASKDKQVGVICLGSPSHGCTGYCQLT